MKLRFFFKKKWVAKLLSAYLKFVYKTTKWTYVNEEILEQTKGKPRIFCFWHENLAMMPFAWKLDEPFYMLLSQHGDGKFIGEMLKSLGPFEAVYGSTNKGGMNAAREIIKLLKTGAAIGITPDGPRGPRRSISPGLFFLARHSDAIIIPVTYKISNSIRLKSWDRFKLPLPFSQGSFFLMNPPPQMTNLQLKDFLNTYD